MQVCNAFGLAGYMITVFMDESLLGQNLNFILTSILRTSLKELLLFYKISFINSKTHFSLSSKTSSYLLSQFLWFNKYIQTKLHLTKFSSKNSNFLSWLFEGGYLKHLKLEYKLKTEMCFHGYD